MSIKVTKVATLGAVCAFKGTEVQVLEQVYNSVPVEKQKDFEDVLVKAQETYSAEVAAVKAKGEKPNPSAIKSKVVSDLVEGFLVKIGVSKLKSDERVIRPKEPKITNAADKIKVDRPKVDPDVLSELYDDNFPIEDMDDSKPEKVVIDVNPEEVEAAGGVILGEGNMFSDDDFNFEDL